MRLRSRVFSLTFHEKSAIKSFLRTSFCLLYSLVFLRIFTCFFIRRKQQKGVFSTKRIGSSIPFKHAFLRKIPLPHSFVLACFFCIKALLRTPPQEGVSFAKPSNFLGNGQRNDNQPITPQVQSQRRQSGRRGRRPVFETQKPPPHCAGAERFISFLSS